MRNEAGRFEADEAITDLEERMERLDHAVKLVQHTTAQHEDRIAGLMYSPGHSRHSVCPRPCPLLAAASPGIRRADSAGLSSRRLLLCHVWHVAAVRRTMQGEFVVCRTGRMHRASVYACHLLRRCRVPPAAGGVHSRGTDSGERHNGMCSI